MSRSVSCLFKGQGPGRKLWEVYHRCFGWRHGYPLKRSGEERREGENKTGVLRKGGEEKNDYSLLWSLDRGPKGENGTNSAGR